MWCHELLQAIINAIYSKPSGVITWFNDPYISVAVSVVLWNQFFHYFVIFHDSVYQVHVGSDPAVACIGMILVVD